jgi:hypothetical protein
MNPHDPTTGGHTAMRTPRPTHEPQVSRLIAGAVATLLATVSTLAMGTPTHAQSLPVEYVGQGGVAQILPSTTCLPTQSQVQLSVLPAQAGTAALGSNGCGVRFTSSASYLGAAEITITSGVSAVEVPVVVVPADEVVVQGDTVGLIPGGCPASLPTTTQIRVTPPEAGTAFLPALRCNVNFTASRTYVGPVTIDIVIPGSVDVEIPRTVVRAPANFVKPTASASGSFTPVAPPPPPGPCILVTANPVVSFGDVTLGGPYRDGDVEPTVAGCAEPSVIQDVLIQASSATNGQTTLETDTSCATPVACAPGEGLFTVALPDDGLVIRSTPSFWLDERSGNFPDESAGLAVKMPETLAPTSVGSIFTFDVVFTAIAVG